MEQVPTFAQLAPELRIKVNGSNLPSDAMADVTEVTVNQDLGAPWMCTARLVNWDPERMRVTWSDDALFSPGAAIEVMLGYVDNLQAVFTGEITGLEPEFSVDQGYHLTVRGHDRSHRLLRGRKTRSFLRIKDSAIASQIAGSAGLTPEVEDTRVQLDYVLQHNQTDLEFLRARAERIGYEVVVEEKLLHFRAPRLADDASVTLSLDSGLLEFYPRLTTLTQVGSVEVRSWSPDTKQEVIGKGASLTTTMGGKTVGPSAVSSAFGSSIAVTVDEPMLDKAQADQVAQARFSSLALEYVTGEGVARGRTDLKAGVVAQLNGLGNRFSGRYYVTSATHSYTPRRGYRTAFTVRRNAT